MRQITRPVLFLRQHAGADYLLGDAAAQALNQPDSAGNKRGTVNLYEYLNANEGQNVCRLIASL